MAGANVLPITKQGSVKLGFLDYSEWVDLGIAGNRDRATMGELYGDVDWMFRCVQLISGTMSTVPFTVGRPGGDPIWDSDDEIVPKAMAQYAKLPQMLTLTAASLPLLGKAYVYRLRNVGKSDVGLKWLLPTSITPKIDDTLGLTHFERTVNSKIRPLPIEDVVYFWYPDPLTEIGEPGHFPGRSAAVASNVLYNMDAFLAAYFKRGMIKQSLLVTKGVTQQADREKLKAWWKRVADGVKNAFGTEVIQADMLDVVTVGEGISELNNSEMAGEKREAISTAFGVPHSLVMSNAANYATAEQDVLTLYQNTVFPLGNVIADHLNDQVFGPMGLVFKWQTQRVEAVQKSELMKAEMVSSLTGTPVLTLNEGRELLGYEPVQGGDEIASPAIQPPQLALPDPEPMPDVEEDPIPAAKAIELDRLHRFCKNGSHFDRPFTSDVLTPHEISEVISQYAYDFDREAYRP